MRFVGAILYCACLALWTPASAAPAPAQTQAAGAAGQRDFDWEFGTWTTRVRVLRNPLSGKPAEWAEYAGTSVVKPLLDGRANFVELAVSGSDGKIEGGSLRLFNPLTRQWSLNFASLRNGLLTAPVFGGFARSGRGTFFGSDTLDGRAILVRFVIEPKAPDAATFEQSYSDDGGQTWEVNWVATDTRNP